jgi:hypothetical protein
MDHAKVDSLRVQIPYSTLYQGKVVVDIDGLHIVFELIIDNEQEDDLPETSGPSETDILQAMKMDKLLREEAKLLGGNANTKSWWSKVILFAVKKLANGFELNIRK